MEKWQKHLQGDRTENYLFHSVLRFRSLVNTHTHTHAHSHIHASLTPHQPALQSSRSSFGSVSCKGPSLGQQGGVQHPDSLSRTEACMANCVMRLLLKDRKTTQLSHCYNKAPGRLMVALQLLLDGRMSGSIKMVSGSSGRVYSISSGQAQHQG